MKRITSIIFTAALALALLATSCANRGEQVKIISYNIRQSGLAQKDGANAWDFRKEATRNMIAQERPEAFGLQESRPDQTEFIRNAFPEYERIGVGRDDGIDKGECMAIFYLKDKYELLDSATFWLSETPDSVSFGWDAACRRTVTMAHLRSLASGADFVYFNTHLDHMGQVARQQSVLLLIALAQGKVPQGTPVIIGGDMNSNITNEIFTPLAEAGYSSARDIAPVTDSLESFNAWGLRKYDGGNNLGDTIIDHIFVKGIEPQTFRTLTGDYGAPYISDHYPVEMTFTLINGKSGKQALESSFTSDRLPLDSLFTLCRTNTLTTVTLADGKNIEVEVTATGNAVANIQAVRVDGRPCTKRVLGGDIIAEGSKITFTAGADRKVWYCADEPEEYISRRPAPEDRLFSNDAVENRIAQVTAQLTNSRLRWMFANCFPNTLDTTVHFAEDGGDSHPDTFVYTGDIHAMWLRDSAAQVWPYLSLADDPQVRAMLEGVIRRQFKCLCLDPYANAFNFGPTGSRWQSDNTVMIPELHERKWEIDSQCYPIRLAYAYWKTTGDDSVFDRTWLEAVSKILKTLREQQRKDGQGPYWFTRECDRQYDMKCNYGYGNPVNPVGLVVSSFRPSDDATVLDFLVPSNFFAVTSLRKAAEILDSVGTANAAETEFDAARLSGECRALADEIETALYKYAVVEHPKYGKIFAFEVDGFGNHLLMDDANVPSLLAMAYLGDIDINDRIYQNTRRFVLSADNPYRFEGAAGYGIGGPHIGPGFIWPMSIMMRAFTSQDDDEIQQCIMQLMTTDAGTGFMHESFNVDDPARFTRKWFAWQNTLFGELIVHLIEGGKLDLLNEII